MSVQAHQFYLTVFVNIVLSPKVSLGSLQEESCLQFIFRNSKIALLFLETVKLHFKPVPRSALLYGWLDYLGMSKFPLQEFTFF